MYSCSIRCSLRVVQAPLSGSPLTGRDSPPSRSISPTLAEIWAAPSLSPSVAALAQVRISPVLSQSASGKGSPYEIFIGLELDSGVRRICFVACSRNKLRGSHDTVYTVDYSCLRGAQGSLGLEEHLVPAEPPLYIPPIALGACRKTRKKS